MDSCSYSRAADGPDNRAQAEVWAEKLTAAGVTCDQLDDLLHDLYGSSTARYQQQRTDGPGQSSTIVRKTTLAYVRIVANTADSLALRRVINEPTRGIGDETRNKIEAWANGQGIRMQATPRRPRPASRTCRRRSGMRSPSASGSPPRMWRDSLNG